jgi:hypothetical protein
MPAYINYDHLKRIGLAGLTAHPEMVCGYRAGLYRLSAGFPVLGKTLGVEFNPLQSRFVPTQVPAFVFHCP